MELETNIEKQLVTNPLVSIIVITYNSSKYVLETLESAKAQTYQNIELIVSDDCSTDNTLEICKNWIEGNKNRFVHTDLITVEKNSGISPNCNRGINAGNGEWLKLIAGDDLLIENCISSFLEFTFKNSSCCVVFGRMYYLKNGKLKENQLNPFFKCSVTDQYKKVFTGSRLPAPASFIKRSLLNEIGGFNENYRFVEDVPLWIAIARRNIYFYSINEFVVKYRIHDSNISISGKSYLNLKYYSDSKKLLITETLPELWHLKQYWAYYNYWNYIIVTNLIVKIGNKNNYIAKLLRFFIVSNIFSTFNKIIRRILNIKLDL